MVTVISKSLKILAISQECKICSKQWVTAFCTPLRLKAIGLMAADAMCASTNIIARTKAVDRYDLLNVDQHTKLRWLSGCSFGSSELFEKLDE